MDLMNVRRMVLRADEELKSDWQGWNQHKGCTSIMRSGLMLSALLLDPLDTFAAGVVAKSDDRSSHRGEDTWARHEFRLARSITHNHFGIETMLFLHATTQTPDNIDIE